MKQLTVIFLEEGESWNVLVRRLRKTEGELLLVLSTIGDDLLLRSSAKERAAFISSISKLSGRVRVATRNKTITIALRQKGMRVTDRLQDLRSFLKEHPQLSDAIREFSPKIWRQQLRSHLQSMGLLSLPKLRIWILILVSVGLFAFVFFRLLPSAEITVTPREDTVSQTANIFLVLSGALVDISEHVRTMELVPITVQVDRTITFDQISREFTGTSSRMAITVFNESKEQYSLRKGTRLSNQAGMIFRLQEPVFVDPGNEVVVMAEADGEDLYGEVIGERGNVPADLKWDFPGLGEDERKMVYGINKAPATGGVSDFQTVLKAKDLDIAERQIKSDLLGLASQTVDEEILLYNQEHRDEVLTRLHYDELTAHTFTGFVLPTQFLGEKVASIPVQGSIIYTAYGYDAQYILTMLADELVMHVEAGKKLLPETVKLERLVVHVIDYEDDLAWIKLTVDLSGTEQAILDPLTPSGARFAKSVREMVIGKSATDARRIVKNFPEVGLVDVSLWPPWNQMLPTIPYHISITVDSQ